VGAVTDVVKRLVPGSYRAMVGVTNSYYDQTDLQGLADYVKFRLFATVVEAIAEATVYDPLLLDFVGKLTTLQFIPAAVDYWGDQLLQETTTGTSEVISYPDRRDGLWKIFDELRAEVQQQEDSMSCTYGFQIYGSCVNIPDVSYGDGGRGVLRTADPMDYPHEFGRKRPHGYPFNWKQGVGA